MGILRLSVRSAGREPPLEPRHDRLVALGEGTHPGRERAQLADGLARSIRRGAGILRRGAQRFLKVAGLLGELAGLLLGVADPLELGA